MIAKEKVILRRVPEYNPALIEKVVTEGLAEFGLESRVHGRITIKPNVVMSHPKVTPSAYTRAEFLDGLLRSLGKTKCGEPHCRGGCHGMFLDWLHMIKDRKPGLWKNLPPWTVVIGKYAGDVDARKLMIIGTCSEIQGTVSARRANKIKGCPPKHKDLVLWFFLKARILNPLFRMDLIYDGYLCLFFTWCRRLLKGRL